MLMEGQLTHIGNVIPYRYDAAKKHKIKQITLLQLVCFQGNCVFHGQFWRSHMHEAQSGAITLNKLKELTRNPKVVGSNPL